MLRGSSRDRTLHILHVEDDVAVRDVTRRILENVGHKVYSVADATAAFGVLSLNVIDIVVMDRGLHGIDGVEATRRIRARTDAMRSVPVVGLTASNDDAEIRAEMAQYFNCGKPENSIDFWGYNIYSWCGDSSFEKSGFDKRTEEFKNYNVPAFFAEYGCNEVQPRKFTEVGALYGDEMTGVWSGGIMYMFHQEVNDYGS